MTRLQQDIEEEIRNLSPEWLFPDGPIGDVLVSALAAVFVASEDAAGGWVDQAFRRLADGPFLEELGEDRGVPRYRWEDIEEYRERAVMRPRGPTPAHIELVVGELLRFEGYEAEFVGLHSQVALEHDTEHPTSGFFTDTAWGVAGNRQYARVWFVDLPIPEVARYGVGAYASNPNTHAFADNDAYASPTHRGQRRERWRMILDWLEEHHPESSAWGVHIRDRFQGAHLDALIPQTGAHL